MKELTDVYRHVRVRPAILAALVLGLTLVAFVHPIWAAEIIEEFDTKTLVTTWFTSDASSPFAYTINFRDTQHVHSGNASARIYFNKANDTADAYSKLSALGRFNLHNFDYLSFWVYNNGGETLDFRLRLEDYDTGVWESQYGSIYPRMTTDTSGWENIVIDLTRSFSGHPYSINMAQIKYMMFIIEPGDTTSADTFWLDDIRVYRSPNGAPFEIFESDFFGWSAGAPFTLARDSAVFHNDNGIEDTINLGQYSLNISWTSKGAFDNVVYTTVHDAASAPFGRIGNDTDYSKNGNTKMAIWIKSLTENSMPVLLKFDGSDVSTQTYTGAGQWQRLVWDYRSNADSTNVAEIIIFPQAGVADASGTIYIDDLDAIGGSAPNVALAPLNITTDAASPDSDGRFTVTWDAVPGATAYHLQYDTNNSFLNPQSYVTSSPSQLVVIQNLQHTTYYLRLASVVSGSDTGSYRLFTVTTGVPMDFATLANEALDLAKSDTVYSTVIEPMVEFDLPPDGNKLAPGLVFEEYEKIVGHKFYDVTKIYALLMPRGANQVRPFRFYSFDGAVNGYRELKYEYSQYNYTSPVITPALPNPIPDTARIITNLRVGAQDDIGGFPVLATIMSSGYFRFNGFPPHEQGSTWRPLMQNTAFENGEQFPTTGKIFMRDYGDTQLILMLLEVYDMTAAYEVVMDPGPMTLLNVRAAIFARDTMVFTNGSDTNVGFGGFSSMIFKGPDSPDNLEAHDADLFRIRYSDGSIVERFLQNPFWVSADLYAYDFYDTTRSIDWFTLENADRRNSHYVQFPQGSYANRPSYRITIKKAHRYDSPALTIPLTVKLFEKFTTFEGLDNIVAGFVSKDTMYAKSYKTTDGLYVEYAVEAYDPDFVIEDFESKTYSNNLSTPYSAFTTFTPPTGVTLTNVSTTARAGTNSLRMTWTDTKDFVVVCGVNSGNNDRREFARSKNLNFWMKGQARVWLDIEDHLARRVTVNTRFINSPDTWKLLNFRVADYAATTVDIEDIRKVYLRFEVNDTYNPGPDTIYLDEFTVGWKSVPYVEFTFPEHNNAKDTYSFRHTTRLTWNVTNFMDGKFQDTRNLRIRPEWSRNNGLTWDTIARYDTLFAYADWNTDSLPDDDTYLLRVVATDGRDTYIDNADTYITILNTRPDTSPWLDTTNPKSTSPEEFRTITGRTTPNMPVVPFVSVPSIGQQWLQNEVRASDTGAITAQVYLNGPHGTVFNIFAVNRDDAWNYSDTSNVLVVSKDLGSPDTPDLDTTSAWSNVTNEARKVEGVADWYDTIFPYVRVSGVQYAQDSVIVSETGYFAATFNLNGPHGTVFDIYAVAEFAGVRSGTSAIRTITKDLVAPAAVTLNSTTETSGIEREIRTITGTSPETNVTVFAYVKVDGVAYLQDTPVTVNSSGTFAITVHIWGDNNKVFSIYAFARDPAMNYSETSNILTVTKTLLGYAENNTESTSCIHEDRANVPMRRESVKTARISAFHPGYADTQLIWAIGADDGSNSEFKQSGLSDDDTFYAPDDPKAGQDSVVGQMPKEINNDWLNNTFLVFTTESGFEKDTASELTIEAASSSGTLELRVLTWNGSSWVSQGSRIFNSSTSTQTWSIAAGSFQSGTDASRIQLDVVTNGEGGASTAGAWIVYDHLRLVSQARVGTQNFWTVGSDDGSSSEFRQSGYADADEYYAQDVPSAGTDEAVSLMPKEINNDVINDQYIKFTADTGLERDLGAEFTVKFTTVSGTMEIKPRTWNGSGWTDQGSRVFNSTHKIDTWTFADSTFQLGTDGNNIHLDVITVGEGSVYTTSGSSGTYDYLRLTRRAMLDRVQNDNAECSSSSKIWLLGSINDTSTEFRQSGFSDGDTFYPTDDPAAGVDSAVSDMPQYIENDAVNDQYLRFTAAAGNERDLGADFTIEMAAVSGTLQVKARTWSGSAWVDQGSKTFTSSSLTQVWSFPDGTFVSGTDASLIHIDVQTSGEGGSSTAGARAYYDYLSLNRRVITEVFVIGANNDTSGEFRQSGYVDANVFYPQDDPPAGVDSPSTQFPRELNNDSINDQFIYFTAEEGTERNIGGDLTIDFHRVTDTLEIIIRTWDGAGWTLHGSKRFDSTILSRTWTLPDGVLRTGVDANQFHIDVITFAEGGASRPGAVAYYDQVKFVTRSVTSDSLTTLYSDGSTQIIGGKVDGWWRTSEATTIRIGSDTVFTNAQYVKILKKVSGTENEMQEVFRLYEDGRLKIKPMPREGHAQIPFTSAILFGRATEDTKPYADIDNIQIDPAALTVDVTYGDNTTARLTLTTSSRTATHVDASAITFLTATDPFATLRSAWIADGYSNVDHVQSSATTGNLYRIGDLTWTRINGNWWWFKRNYISENNTLGPDVKLEILTP